jgi:hypothetical protein
MGSDEESSDPSATGRHHADYSIDRLAYRNRDLQKSSMIWD